MDSDFLVRFWGVRGSIPCPGGDTAGYGGNTPCVEMRCGQHVLIFDAGTGLRSLGRLLATDGVTEADLFLSHTHIDHIVGFPFFRHAFKPGNRLRVWSGHLENGETTESVLRRYMSPPIFPITPDAFAAAVSYHDFRAGEPLAPKPGITLRTAGLNHPQNATGYRVEYGGRSVCYVTDTEHRATGLDENVISLIENADIAIYDAMFTDAELPRFAGWGHSTWEEGVRLCKAARVPTLVIFHHRPERSDDELDRIAEEAARAAPGAIVAREGMALRL